MRKILIFLMTIVLCAGCKNYQADIDDYLSYWSAEASIVRYNFDPAITVPTDKESIPSIPSASDVLVTFIVRNPKNFNFKLPGQPASSANITVFRTGVEGADGTNPPKQPTDYELIQDSSSKMTLKYKAAFLQKHEYGQSNIGPTITLYADNGRKFHETFTLNVKANTPPPNLTYRAIGKTATPDGNGKQYYVLFLEAKGMDTAINGSVLLHKDVAQFSIAEGGGSYASVPLKVKEDKSGFDISSAGGRLLEAGETTELLPADITTGSLPDSLPSGKWILRIKTDVPVGGATKQYRFRLGDEAGLYSSDELKTSTNINKVRSVEIIVTSGTWSETPKSGTNADPHEIAYQSGTGKILLQAKTATSGAVVYYRLERNGSTVNESSGTTPVTIELSAVPDAVYKLTAWAVKEGFENSPEEVVCYKTKRNNTVEISAGSNAWGQLKAAVAVAEDGDIFLVNGTIKATSADGNSGAIEVTKSITIKGKNNNANTDMLDANSHHSGTPPGDAPVVKHRIFTVKSGGNLTLENLTLTKGLASGSGAAQDGGAIYNEGTLTMYGGILDFNKAEHWGGGIYTRPGARVTLGSADGSRPCTIKNNTGAHEGGGIYNQGNLTMHGGSIEMNTTLNDGGGLYIHQGDCILNTVDIHDNIVGAGKKGSGIYLYPTPGYTPSLTLTGTAKVGNSGNTNTLYLCMVGNNSAFVTAKDLTTSSHINIEPYDYGLQKDKTLVKVTDTSAAAYKDYFHLTNAPSTDWVLAPSSDDKELILQKETVVAGGGSGAWDRLKTAIHDAELGDTIIIDGTIQATSPGNFGEIAVSKSITIRGKNGNPATDVLDANKGGLGLNAHRIFKVTGTHTKLTLENITLKNGKAAGSTGEGKLGGGIYCKSINHLTIKNCIIEECEAEVAGGGIYVFTGAGHDPTEVSIANTKILQNKAVQFGGGLEFMPEQDTGITVTLDRVTVEGNSLTGTVQNPDYGGAGIFFSGGYNNRSKLTVKGGSIEGNNAGNFNGGGIYIATGSNDVCGTLTLTDGVRISGNTATNGGGVAVHSAKLIIEPGCTIGGDDPSKGNKTLAGGKGGGIYVGKKAECTIKEDVTIRHNTANANNSTLNGGGGIYVGDPDSTAETDMGTLIVEGTADKPVNIQDCITNDPSGAGGGIYSKGKVTLTHARISGCKAPDTGGLGGGIFVRHGQCTLIDSEVKDCEALSGAGGGVYVYKDALVGGLFTMQGSSRIVPSGDNGKGKNDIFLLEITRHVNLSRKLTGTTPVGRITVPDTNYNASTIVLDGNVHENYKKFTVTLGGSPSQNWYIDSNGKLTTTQP